MAYNLDNFSDSKNPASDADFEDELSQYRNVGRYSSSASQRNGMRGYQRNTYQYNNYQGGGHQGSAQNYQGGGQNYQGAAQNYQGGSQNYQRGASLSGKIRMPGRSGNPYNNWNNDQNYQGYGDDNINNAIDQGNLRYSASQYSRNGGSQYSHNYLQKKKRNSRVRNGIKIGIGVILLAAIAVGVYVFFPITVKVNGQDMQFTYSKTLGDAIENSEKTYKPGNFVAVDYSIITKDQGHEFYAEINGVENLDTKARLKNGDEVTIQDGKDIMEDYTSVDTDIKATCKTEGTGSLHKVNGSGEPGTWSVLTGKVSKKTAERQTKDPDNVTVKNYNPDPGTDKVICLTFDDGPSNEYTEKILNVLKKYDAKATFFTIGENIEYDDSGQLLSKEAAAGHQVCTHTYDHARGYGATDITGMPAEEQILEITKGQQLIAKATGNEASRVVRLPGGNSNNTTYRLLAPYIDAEIGWNLDTADWTQPGVEKIKKALNEASSGDVILCHDGGGDRSETVEALEWFLPEYTKKGYKFITIDEMLEYPEAKQKTTSFQ